MAAIASPHAVSGFLLFGPAWAARSTSPAGIFTFPNNDADAVLHITTGVLFGLVAAIQLGLDRGASPSLR